MGGNLNSEKQGSVEGRRDDIIIWKRTVFSVELKHINNTVGFETLKRIPHLEGVKGGTGNRKALEKIRQRSLLALKWNPIALARN